MTAVARALAPWEAATAALAVTAAEVAMAMAEAVRVWVEAARAAAVRAVVDSVVEGLAVAVGLVVTVARAGMVVTLAAARKVVAARAVADLVRAVAATVGVAMGRAAGQRPGRRRLTAWQAPPQW